MENGKHEYSNGLTSEQKNAFGKKYLRRQEILVLMGDKRMTLDNIQLKEEKDAIELEFVRNKVSLLDAAEFADDYLNAQRLSNADTQNKKAA